MRAIVLSPGPSLATYQPREADLTFAVNRAATKFECDVWVASDLPLIEKIHEQVIGKPLLVSYGVSLDNLRDRKWKWRGEQWDWKPLESFLCPQLVNWPWCSFTAAIVFAAFKGATSVDVYGADWYGTNDFDGVQAGMNRSEERWRHERSLFAALKTVLEERGCKVTRRKSDELC